MVEENSQVFGAPSEQRLRVDYAGSVRDLEPGMALTFGRAADLIVDDNPYLHRIVGRFSWRDGLWWLHNSGSRIPLDVIDCSTASTTTLRPGASASLHVPALVVRFEASRSNYELDVHVAGIDARPSTPATPDGVETITFANVPLTADQRRLILALAEPALRNPLRTDIEVPSNRQAALRLGWTLTRFNRKLDNVCQKLAKQGVTGLHGDLGGLATARRRRLVEDAIQSGLVQAADLHLLDMTPCGVSVEGQPSP